MNTNEPCYGLTLFRNLPGIVIRALGCAAVGLFCLFGAFQAWSADCLSPPGGLAGWWPFESNAVDIIGGDNGSVQGNCTFGAGEVGTGIGISGAPGGVSVPDNANLDFGPGVDFSLELWIQPLVANTAFGVMGLIDKRVVPNLGHSLGYALAIGDGHVACQMSDSLASPFLQTASAGPDLRDGAWHHVALTVMRAATNGGNLYVDGQVVLTFDPTSQPGDLTTTAPVLIGLAPASLGLDTNFRGAMDEVSIYRRALTAPEVQAIYNAGSAGKCPLPRAATALATVVDGFLVRVSLVDSGWGYTNTPGVRIIGGGGSGALPVAVVSNGVVIAVNLLDAGNGYTNTPVIVIEPPFIKQPTMGIAAMSLLSFTNLALGTNYQLQSFLGNTWSNVGAAFTAAGPAFTQYVSGTADPNDYRLALSPVPLPAFAKAELSYGFVVHATVTSGGSGYVTNPAVTIVGGGGTDATAVAQISGGVVTNITITDAGIGYTNTPTVEIAPPPVAAVSPTTVSPIMRVDFASLSPYDNYQIQFKPSLGGAWGNWSGGLFSPTDVTISQYLSITNDIGFFRLQYMP